MKNRRTITLVLSLILIVSFSACKKTSCDECNTSNFALAVGNYWTYEESYYYPDTASIPIGAYTVKQVITKDTILENGQLAFIMEQFYPTSSARFLRYEVNGELRERYIYSPHYSVLAKQTMNTGDEWAITSTSNWEFNYRKVVAFFPNYAFINTVAPAYKLQYGNPNLKYPEVSGEFMEEIYVPSIGVVESNYSINYYGPSRRQRILTDYYTN